MTRQDWTRLWLALTCMTVIGVAAIQQFGLLNGCAVLCFTWLVTPYAPRR